MLAFGLAVAIAAPWVLDTYTLNILIRAVFFAMLALLSCAILWNVGHWYENHGLARLSQGRNETRVVPTVPRRRALGGIIVLLALILSKYVYLASITSYFTFYLMHRFFVSITVAQYHLFAFLAAVAVGTVAGGPLGDRFGRKYVIWFSILGALPFTLALPYAGLAGSAVLTVFIGLILSSATSSIIVFAQELMPHRFGMISGVFFGVAFGIGGLGAAVLGKVADHTGIAFVYQLCAFLPVLGLLAVFLPKMPKLAR